MQTHKPKLGTGEMKYVSNSKLQWIHNIQKNRFHFTYLFLLHSSQFPAFVGAMASIRIVVIMIATVNLRVYSPWLSGFFFVFFFSSILGKKPNLMSKLGSLQYQVKPDAILENRWVEMSNWNGNLSEDVSLECGIIFWYQWIKLWLYEKQEFGLKRYCIVERNLKAANYWEIKWLFRFGISQ